MERESKWMSQVVYLETVKKIFIIDSFGKMREAQNSPYICRRTQPSGVNCWNKILKRESIALPIDSNGIEYKEMCEYGK